MQGLIMNLGKMTIQIFLLDEEVINCLGNRSFVQKEKKNGDKIQAAAGWGMNGKGEKGESTERQLFKKFSYEKAEEDRVVIYLSKPQCGSVPREPQACSSQLVWKSLALWVALFQNH